MVEQNPDRAAVESRKELVRNKMNHLRDLQRLFSPSQPRQQHGQQQQQQQQQQMKQEQQTILAEKLQQAEHEIEEVQRLANGISGVDEELKDLSSIARFFADLRRGIGLGAATAAALIVACDVRWLFGEPRRQSEQ